MTQQLSPAAQVMIAVTHVYQDHDGDPPARAITAAALLAVAEQVVAPKYQYADWEMADLIMQEIQDIVNELDAQSFISLNTMTDYKQLCAELVDIWDATADFDYKDFGQAVANLVVRASASLTEPEPEEPTDKEIL